MVSESWLCKTNQAAHEICRSFARIIDLSAEDTSLRTNDTVRSTSPSPRQSLRWTLPFLWLALVYLSFICSYSAVYASVFATPGAIIFPSLPLHPVFSSADYESVDSFRQSKSYCRQYHQALLRNQPQTAGQNQSNSFD